MKRGQRLPRLLDLFCGAGGAATGYARAGFEVIGVDIAPMPRYPYNFIQADALETLQALISEERIGIGYSLDDFDAIHASPPCQRFSTISNIRPGLKQSYPDLIEPTRFLLRRSHLPSVIENVEYAPLNNAVVLCGSQFGLTTDWPGHGTFYLKRHRQFEPIGFRLPEPGAHDHNTYQALTVAGHGNPCQFENQKGPGYLAAARRLMQIDWMRRDELNEAVPPAYSLYVGSWLKRHLYMSGTLDVYAS
jgi:DNA (cytosine-5)-methyltransferase 1